MRAGRLLLFAGGGDGIDAPLAGDDAVAYPATLGQFTISAPLAGGDSDAFAAALVFGQAMSAPLAGSDSVVYPAALSESLTILAPLAGADAVAYAPAGLPFLQTLLAPLAGDAAVVYPATLAKDQFLLAPLADSGAWVFPAQVLGTTEVAALAAGGMTVKVLDRASHAVLATLSLADSKSWMDQVDDTGSGTCTIPNDDPDYADTDFDRLLQFNIGGQARFLSVIEDRDVVTLTPQGGGAQQTTLKGRGALAILSEGVVLPSRGVGSLPIETVRSFAWPAVDFDDAGWPQAKTLALQRHISPLWHSALPRAWPDPLAGWIWADRDDCSWMLAPPGPCLFRRSFTLAAATKVRIFASFDNAGECYLDGAKIITSDTFFEGEFVEVTLSAGEHVLALRGVNYPDDGAPGGNPGAVILTMFSVVGGFLDEVLLRTDWTWKCLPYPVREPGFTVGRVLRLLLEDAQSAGACLGVTLGFTDFLDSDGMPWEEQSEVTAGVGRSLLEVVQEMAGSLADIAMAPGATQLRAWRFGERGSTKAVTLAEGSNLAALGHQGKRTTVNAVLALYAGGWIEETDAASIAANGRRSAYMDLSAVQSEERARELARTVMTLRASPRYAVRADLSPVDGAEARTLLELEPGDTITAPNESLAPESVRVRAITVVETDHGRVDQTLQLNDMAEELEIRFDRWLRRMNPGALAGGSQIVAPGDDPPISQRRISTVYAAEFSFEGTVNTSSVVRLLLNGAYIGSSVSFTSGDEQKISLDPLKVLGNTDHMQIEVDGVRSPRRPATTSGNLIDFVVTRTGSAAGTAGLDAQARAI